MAAAQWERLKTGLGIAEPVPAEPESFPQQLLHQLDEATTLSKTQASTSPLWHTVGLIKPYLTLLKPLLHAESVWICNMPGCWPTVWVFGQCQALAMTITCSTSFFVHPYTLCVSCSQVFSF